MSVLFHIDRLKEKHTQLEKSIFLEYLRPLPSTQVLSELKHKKLLIKDEIQRLSSYS